jgi:pimeloyl-ACP methyl ester carboxylesterase
MPQIRTFEAGVSIRYADYGGEGPPIVLVHGLGGIHLNWMRIAPELTRYGRVLALDLPGFGGSPPLRGGTSVAALESALGRFLDGVTEGPITLGGNSLGGALSLLVAARRPDRVRRLMLFSPAVPHAYFEPVDVRAFFTMGAAMLPYVGPSSVQGRPSRLGPERLVKEMMAFMTHNRRRIPRDVLAAHIEEARAKMDREWIGEAFSDALRSLSWLLLRRGHFASVVRQVAVPTLVFAGERDRLVRLRSIRHMCAWNKAFQLQSWPDVGHVAQLEVPERVLPVIDRFFSDHPIQASVAAA